MSFSAESLPDLRFDGHELGETAETFLATATMMESKALTKDYCDTLLADSKTREKYDAAKTAASKQDVFVLNKKTLFSSMYPDAGR